MAISQKEAERLKCCVGNYRLHRLKELRFYTFQDIDILYWFLHRIPNLERLMLYGCFLKEVLPKGSLVACEKIGTVVRIKDLTLAVPILENIGFEHDLVLQRLERLFLYYCSNLITLAPSTVSFTHLKSLEVSQCDKLSNLMASSTAKSLVKLTRIRVAQCKAMGEIIAKEGNEEERVEIVFSKLVTLELVSLDNLTRFCNLENPNLNFPVLEKLIVIECPKMKTFSEGLITAPILRHVYLAYAKEEEEGKWCWEGDLNATIRKISTDMVSFKNAEHLKLSDYPKLEQVWHAQVSLPDTCFCNLKFLEVNNCNFLSSAIPFNLLLYLKNLEVLQVSKCNLVEVIFDMNDTNMTKTEGNAFRLKTLSLDNLPNLKQVWNKDPQGCVSFRNLQDVFVHGCKRLKTLFPRSVAKNLSKLGKRTVISCRALEEIVGKEDAASDGAIDEIFEFHCLTTLYQSELLELKCFYPGRFNLKCPTLSILFVYHCGKLEIFASESQSYEEAAAEDQDISIEAQPLFSEQEVIPILESFTLSEKDTNMLRCGGFQEKLDKLKWLELVCFHSVNETDHLPDEILLKVSNIETLAVTCSSFKEIFLPHQPEDHNITKHLQLKQLQLTALPRLYSIGLQHSGIDKVHESLEILEINACPCLTKVVPSSVSFSNLKQLFISECHGLECLFTSSTARSLMRLENITIGDCESLKEIVAEEGDEADPADEIIFEQLKRVDLNSLPSFAGFYRGNAALKFPNLNAMKIIQCPRMKTFSRWDIVAPWLRAIQVSNTMEFCWEHDLKLTIDKLFRENVSFAFIEILKLHDYPELEQIWVRKTPLPDKCFSELTTSVVENCEFLSVVIPSHLLPYLNNLEELQIRNCNSVEVIFDTSETQMSATEEKASLLKRLTLDQLPNLKRVWNKNPQWIISFEKLKNVKVRDCESLQYLFPAASMAKSLVKLEIQNCGALVEILGEENAAASGSGTFEFPYLTTLILNHLPELNYFYPGRLNLKCPVLKVLNVYHCGKLEMCTSETKSNQALREDQVGVSVNAPPVFMVEEVTSKLEEVSLNEKETITLWNEELQANFLQNIKCLQLYCFHRITDQEDILPYRFLRKVPNIEILAVACSDFKEIFPSRGLKDDYMKMLAQLKGLRLKALPKLDSIGLEHSWLVPLNETLETLEIRSCFALTNIVRSAVSFSNLKELSVTECHRLVYLFTSSTAKSLVQLRKMSISKCKSIREIVAKGENESSEDELVFGNLTKLSLNNLSSLGCFYTGRSTLRFSYLRELIIAQCSKMKNFSEGFISAPQLPSIQASLDEKDVRWEGDLNNTVKKLFKGKDVIVHP